MKQLASLDNLIDLFSSLPQITKKQAKNIALYLINKDEAYIDKFFLALKNSKNKLHFCSQCNCLTEKNKCDICCDYTRDFSKLCIVTSNDDLEKIESTESFKGLYFVLNKELDAKKNAGFEEDVLHKLLDLISLYKPNEIIMATNWTLNGEHTASVVRKYINDRIKYHANFFRIACGLPVNSSIDYADQFTLKYAVENKTKY